MDMEQRILCHGIQFPVEFLIIFFLQFGWFTEKAVRKAVKSKNTDEMLSAADRLERLLDELGVTNGSGPYRPAGGYENPNDDVEDEAVDAEYESVDDSRS